MLKKLFKDVMDLALEISSELVVYGIPAAMVALVFYLLLTVANKI